MKNLNAFKSPLYFSLMLLPFLVVLVSCGGCKGTKGMVKSESKNEDVDTVNDNKTIIKYQKKSRREYPYTIENVTYINDSTKIVDGIKFQGEKMIFPNGRTLYGDYRDIPILKDYPKENFDYRYSSGNKNSGFYNFSKIGVKDKRKLFSNMDGYDSKEVDAIVKARFGLHTHGVFESYERIYRVFTMNIYQEETIIGNVGLMEIYSRNGELLHEIKLDKFGGDKFCITPDNKYIILNTIGDEGSDYPMVSKGATTIWSFENPKLLDIVYHIDNSHGTRSFECYNNHILFITTINDTDSIFAMNILLDKKTISTLSYEQDRDTEYRVEHDGSFRFSDGSIYKKGTDGYNQYTFLEWNELVNFRREKKNEK